MSARYPIRFGLQHQVIWSGQPAGLHLNESTLPAHLRASGYACHATGKWHLGFYSWQHTPTYRGFSSFLGYFGGGEDYNTHIEGDGSHSPGAKLGSGYDFWRQICVTNSSKDNSSQVGCSHVDKKAKGVYSTGVFSSEAVRIINEHDTGTPLFLYVPFQAVHGPLQAPEKYIALNSHIVDNNRRTFAGMVTAADEGIGNITAALERNLMMDRTLMFVITDNGYPRKQNVFLFCVV